MSLRAAVFDFDGVIVDSEPLHFRALRDALLDDGVAITEEEYWGIYLAHDDRGAVRLALEHHGQAAAPDRVEQVAVRKAERFAQLVPEVPVFPGARELVGALASELPLGIASGARHEEIETILNGIGLRSAFAAIVGVEDAARTKPHPAPYLEAARRLATGVDGLRPAECLAFEDSLPGIASALGAGMKVVGVAHSYPAEKLKTAHHVVDSLVGVETEGLRDLFAG